VVRVVGVNTTTDFKYDALGRRIVTNVTSGSQSEATNYYYSGNQVIEERDGNDNVLRQYIYGNGIDKIIRMDKYEGTTVTSYYYHTDANGSVTSITDKDGNLVERVTYDIYGMPTFWNLAGNVIPKSLIGNNILFQGREYDEETNLYYYRARYYDPIMGRFLQADPMGYQDSMNLYQAFNMNGVNFVDPMGTVIHEWKNLGVYGPASKRPGEPLPYQLPNYDESGAYAAFSDYINIEPVQKSDGKWTIRASFKMVVLIWLTHQYKLEHEKAHVIQYMDLYMRILRFLEKMEDVGDRAKYETRQKAQERINDIAGKDYSEIKKMTIQIEHNPSLHDKEARKEANKKINESNYFKMKKPTDPPFKVRKFENVKSWVDFILGAKEENEDEK
jgi:RHS repeat-associated protein